LYSRIDHEKRLGRAVGSVPTVTPNTGAGIWIDRLPARQESMEMVVPAPVEGHILMALEAAIIADRLSQDRRLDGRPGIERQGIMRLEHFCLDTSDHPNTRVTIDTADTFRRMDGGQIHRLGSYRALVEGGFGLGMARSAEVIMGLFRGSERKPARREKERHPAGDQ
jgi:hypothetical protein